MKDRTMARTILFCIRDLLGLLLLDRIVAARMVWVAAGQAHHAKVQSFQESVAFDGRQSVFGAAGMETAALGQERGEANLVSPDQGGRYFDQKRVDHLCGNQSFSEDVLQCLAHLIICEG